MRESKLQSFGLHLPQVPAPVYVSVLPVQTSPPSTEDPACRTTECISSVNVLHASLAMPRANSPSVHVLHVPCVPSLPTMRCHKWRRELRAPCCQQSHLCSLGLQQSTSLLSTSFLICPWGCSPAFHLFSF